MPLKEIHCRQSPMLSLCLDALQKLLRMLCHTSQSSQLPRLEMILKNQGNTFDYSHSVNMAGDQTAVQEQTLIHLSWLAPHVGQLLLLQ